MACDNCGYDYCICDLQKVPYVKQIDQLEARISELESQIECAKVSLDKFYDTEYAGDICNQAVEVREMYCKLGDENDSLKAEIAKLKRIAQDDAEVIGGDR